MTTTDTGIDTSYRRPSEVEQFLDNRDDRRRALFHRLREPFPEELIGTIPAGRKTPALPFVGHGAVTSRLLEVDPEWNWEPVAGTDEYGEPRFVRDPQGNPIRLWIHLTVLGVTRLGVGTVTSGAIEPEKQLVSGALKSAAMRFGVALDLWIKGDHEAGEGRQTPAPTFAGMDDEGARGFGYEGVEDMALHHKQVKELVEGLDDDQRQVVASYREQEGYGWPLTLEQLGDVAAHVEDLLGEPFMGIAVESTMGTTPVTELPKPPTVGPAF